MERKQRRSSLKPVVNNNEDEITMECVTRPKRRISFSGKKLIREFLVEEEAQTWKYSYEESEQADSTGNGSANSNNVLSKTLSILKVGELNYKHAILWDNKENIDHREYVTQGQNLNLQSNAFLGNDSVCDLPLGENGFSHLENSLGITLLEQEKRAQKARLSMIQLNEMRGTPSFSLDENEVIPWKLPAENTIDFMNELRRSNKNMNQINRLSVLEVTQKYSNKNSFDTIVDNNSIMDDEVIISGNNTINTAENVPKSNSICRLEDMDITLESSVKGNGNVSNYDPTSVKSKTNHIESKQVEGKAIDIMDEMITREVRMETNAATQNAEIPMEISTLNTEGNLISERSKPSRKTIHYDVNIPIEAEDTEWDILKDLDAKPDKSSINLEHQKSRIFNMSLSDGLSSPLFSPDYIPAGFKKNLNLRELCDAIGQGKIQVFPDAPKSSASARKDKRKQNSNTSNKESEIIANTEIEIETDIRDRSERNSCKRNLCYSLSDDVLLDTTSFLAKARLEDETISNNNSRSSTLQRRQTIHFNSKIDIEPVECNENRDLSDCTNEIGYFKTEENENRTPYINKSKEEQRENLPFSVATEQKEEHIAKNIVDIVIDHDADISHSNHQRTINIQKDIELDDEYEQEIPNSELDSINHAQRHSEYLVIPSEKSKFESAFFKCEVQNMHMQSLRVESVKFENFESPTTTASTETRDCTRKLFEGTPHRSMIEFEQLERQANLDQQQHDNVTLPTVRRIARRETTYEPVDIVLDVSGLKPLDVEKNGSLMDCASPIENSLTNKRSTINLTPNLPLSKKRQTINFKNCGIAISPFCKSLNASRAMNKVLNTRRTILVPEPIVSEADNSPLKTVKNEEISLEDDDQKMSVHTDEGATLENDRSVKDSDILLNENIENIENLSLQPRDTASLIPVPIGNVRKNTFMALQRSCAVDDSNYNCSLETIEMPRATMVQRKDSILPEMSIVCRDKSVIDLQKQQSVICIDDENPITISDVSVFYSAQCQNPTKLGQIEMEETLKTHSVFADNSCVTQDSAKDVEEDVKSSKGTETFLPPGPYMQDLCDETTVNNMKQFINLNCSGSSLIDKDDDIEKTRLSLVETLPEDERDTDIVVDDVNMENVLLDSCIACESQNIDVEQEELHATVNDANISLRRRVLCRRCKCVSLSESDVSPNAGMESFMLPSVPVIPVLNMSRLRKLRTRPALTDVYEFYRRVSLDRSFNLDALSDCEFDETCNGGRKAQCEDLDHVDIFINDLNMDLIRNSNIKIEVDSDKASVAHMSVVQRLDSILKEKEMAKNWIFNYQRQSSQLLIFNHRKIPTFTITIVYDELTDFGEDIILKSIQLKQNSIHCHWKPIDFVMDFQLRMELPIDLQTLCPGSNEYAIYEMLERVDEMCSRVHELSLNLWMLVCSKEATLVEIANTVYVEKIERNIVVPEDAHAYMEHMVFRIELMNFRKVCFKDIVAPPLHRFREDVQELSVGFEFLSKFLTNPKMYLKN